MQLTSIINGALIDRKGVRVQQPVMRPDESIEDVLEQNALERLALDALHRGRAAPVSGGDCPETGRAASHPGRERPAPVTDRR